MKREGSMPASNKPHRLFGPWWASALVAGFSLLFFALFLFLVIAKLRNYDVLIYDLVNFNMLHGEILDYVDGRSTTFPFAAGVLMQPLLAFAYLPNAFLSSNLWAAGFTTLFASLSIFSFYLLLRQVTEHLGWSLLLTFVFALNPIVLQNAMLGYQPGPYVMVFFFLELLFLARRQFNAFVICLILANFSRFSTPLVNLLMGFALSFSPKTRRYGLCMIIASVLWIGIVAILLKLNIHLTGSSFDSSSLHLNAYGESATQAIIHVLTNPAILARHIFIQDNLLHLFQFMPLLFLPFLAPEILVGLLGDLSYVLLTSSSVADVTWMKNLKAAAGERIFFHNNMIIVVVVMFGAAAFGLRRFLDGVGRWKSIRWMLGFLLVILSLWHHYANASVNAGLIPFTKGFNWKYYQKCEHARVIDEAWDHVPDGVRVKAMQQLFGLQGSRMERYYHFSFSPDGQVFDWVLVDLFAFSYMEERQDTLRNIRGYLTMNDFGVLFFQDGVVLMKRGYSTEKNQEVLKFMEENQQNLTKNFLNPYILGPEPGPHYSATQLID